MVGCSASDQLSTAPASVELHDPIIEPDCKQGFCTGDPDPSPASPGIWLGEAVTPDFCFTGLQTDTDQDGLSTFCEENLATAFAPQLFYKYGENMGMEPKWVARPSGDYPMKVVVGYLLSYYRDEGGTTAQCSVPGAPSSCFGHNGDSEAIYMQVYYNGSTHHWVLDRVWLSHHGCCQVYLRDTSPYPPQFTYPGGNGIYPRVWVSQGKKANYSTQDECNDGGQAFSDTCNGNATPLRVAAGGQLNLGSRGVHTAQQDSMVSNNPNHPNYGSGRYEYYWTSRRFRGWYPTSVGGADADPYSSQLALMGF